MIVIEERLNEVFEQLPEIDGFKPVYKWGNEFHLTKQLKLFADGNESPYPLIYQTSNSSKQLVRKRIAETDLVFILACRNLDTTLLNENRWEMSYKNILYPLLANIEKAIKRSNIFLWDGEYMISEFPNYGNGEENKTIDIWDALRLEVSLTVNTNCVNEIDFNI